jgi:hypothetical protein
MAWLMARPEREVLQVIPRGVSRDAPDGMHGVFAVRSPARPNPIGLTSARVVKVDGLRLHFDALDFVDGTPVLDLKPYFASRDLIFSARNQTIGKPRSVGERRVSLLMQALRFIPQMHADVALAVRILEHFGGEVNSVEAPLSRPFLVDALMGMTRLSLSNGLRLGMAEEVVVNGTRRYAAPVGDGFVEVMAASNEELFGTE